MEKGIEMTMTNDEGEMMLAESVQRFATPEQLAKVREYVRAHRNRVWTKQGGTLRGHSKSLRDIAAELDMPSAIVREAMLDSGWWQALTDAERAVDAPAATVQAPAATKATKRPRKQAKFNPHGWTE